MYKITVVNKENHNQLFTIINNVHHITKNGDSVYLYGNEQETIYFGLICLLYCDLEIEEEGGEA